MPKLFFALCCKGTHGRNVQWPLTVFMAHETFIVTISGERLSPPGPVQKQTNFQATLPKFCCHFQGRSSPWWVPTHTQDLAGHGHHCTMGHWWHKVLFGCDCGTANQQVPEGPFQHDKWPFLCQCVMEHLFINYSGELKDTFFFLRQWSRVGSALHKRFSSISSSDNGIKYMMGGNSLHLLLNEVRNLALLSYKNV